METRKLFALLAIAASFALSGCPVVLLGAGVAGGYAISKDSVTNNYDLSKNRAYDAGFSVLKEMGQVITEDKKNGLIKGKIKDVDVAITIKQLTRKTVELKVSGRNQLKMPSVDVAQEVYNKIDERLKKPWPF